MSVILAFAEQRNNTFRKTAFEVAGTAARLAGDMGGQAVALVAGADVEGMGPELGKYGVSTVKALSDASFKDYTGESYATAVCEAAKTLDAKVILFPASSMGKDLAPRVAALLGCGMASDCIELKVEDGNLSAKRPLYGGKVHAWVTATTDSFVLTLRPNVFTAEAGSGGDAAVDKLDGPAAVAGGQASLKEILQEASGKIDLTEANIIVAGGRGMKGPENYKFLEELAGLLKGAVGASRAAVDSGWRPHSDQVGQTGKTVSPTLYIACGISGAIQHLAGMSSSKFIVAINKDADAPIFKVSDYGVVGDLFEVIPALIEQAKKL